MPAPSLAPFPDLASAATATMRYLQQQFGLGMWLFNRLEGRDLVVLDTLGSSYAVAPGAVFSWTDTLCKPMVEGDGPMIAPRAMDVPAFNTAPAAGVLQIESYVGIPIYRGDGSLFGTMCGIDENPRGDIEHLKPLVELMSRTLGFAVDRQQAADDAARRAERAENDALKDGLTGIFNRRGWDQLLSREEDRRRRYGYPACAFVVDLDGFKTINDTLGHSTGDRILRKMAMNLTRTFRPSDVIARTGGDEFSILAIECDAAEGQSLLGRLNERLADEAILASVGYDYKPSARLFDVWNAADEAMYRAKRARRPQTDASAA